MPVPVQVDNVKRLVTWDDFCLVEIEGKLVRLGPSNELKRRAQLEFVFPEQPVPPAASFLAGFYHPLTESYTIFTSEEVLAGIRVKTDGMVPDVPPLAIPGTPATPVNELANHPLKADPQLNAKMSLDLRRPYVEDLLECLSAATGLKFYGDANVDLTAPVFATITVNDKPAWEVMEQLAQTALVRGEWEKQADGSYLLKGGPKLEFPSETKRNWWIAGIGAILLAAAVVVYKSKRSNK